jgi:hypothetical protein
LRKRRRRRRRMNRAVFVVVVVVVGERGELVGLRTDWVQWRKNPQEKSWVLSFG